MQINVLEYLEQGALAKYPKKIGIVDGTRRHTFEEMARFARNCAQLILDKIPDAANRPVAVFLPKSADAVIADLGILYSGNCYANLDIKSPPERLRTILQNLGAGVVITAGKFAG